MPLVWLLSAYRADSHAYWADWLVASQPQFRWERLELSGRHFRWRIRGNPLSWLDCLPSQPPALIVATSMVDLATLRGLHPRLARVPAIYYFHENQFAYPRSARQSSSVEPQMVQLYGALAAQMLLFNSAFNRDSFLDGVSALMSRLPDHVPSGLVERLAAKSDLCPVPIVSMPRSAAARDRLILWNHRWEYDKQPDQFADAMQVLAQRGVDFSLALLGGRPTKPPPALQRLRKSLGRRIVADARLPTPDYRALLSKAGVVVSTAAHEFQGLAVLEAVAAGACPLVPDGLCYPEQYPPAFRYPRGDTAVLVERIAVWFTNELPAAPDISAWSADSLGPRWAQFLVEGQHKHVE